MKFDKKPLKRGESDERKNGELALALGRRVGGKKIIAEKYFRPRKKSLDIDFPNLFDRRYQSLQPRQKGENQDQVSQVNQT